MSDAPATAHRPIRSFVLRAGRLSPAQARALDELWPRHGVDYRQQRLDTHTLFGRTAPLVLEIGFGMGETTAQIAAAHPELDFLAIDVHAPGVGSLLRHIEAASLGNVRVMRHDAVEVVRDMLAPDSLHGVHVYFPDPWPKARHHKRRLLQPPFVALLASRLAAGGYFHCATDWEHYAEQMLEVLGAEPLLVNTAAGYAGRPEWRPPTKFERRGVRLGHGVWDLLFRRREERPAAVR
ncbi:MAG: tRNA (guanosine(46)-N7)-methyltransferase TrmB [Pseudomonadota bacterium]|nr:tRNA (guanosine(46)-N7)-methyltransferase TrmB [Pseudomonadota bacterium]